MRLHLDAGGDALLERGHVRDHADQLALPAQPGERLQGGVQGLVVQGAEPLVQEQRVHPHLAAGHVGEAQRQRQADEEALAAAQVLGGTDHARLVAVDHVQLQRLVVVADEQVAIAHPAQLLVGMTDHQLEGQPLGEVAEPLAVGRADQFVQAPPARALPGLRQDGRPLFPDQLPGGRVCIELVLETGDTLPQLLQRGLVCLQLHVQLVQGLVRDRFGQLLGQAGVPVLAPGLEVGPARIQRPGPGGQRLPLFRGQPGGQERCFVGKARRCQCRGKRSRHPLQFRFPPVDALVPQGNLGLGGAPVLLPGGVLCPGLFFGVLGLGHGRAQALFLGVGMAVTVQRLALGAALGALPGRGRQVGPFFLERTAKGLEYRVQPFALAVDIRQLFFNLGLALHPGLPGLQSLFEFRQKGGNPGCREVRDAQGQESLQDRLPACAGLGPESLQACLHRGQGLLGALTHVRGRCLVIFTIDQLVAGQSFGFFQGLDDRFLVLGPADPFTQRGDCLLHGVGFRHVAGRERVLGRPAERAGRAVRQFGPVLRQFRNPCQEGHFPQQGLLLGAVFPQQPSGQHPVEFLPGLLQFGCCLGQRLLSRRVLLAAGVERSGRLRQGGLLLVVFGLPAGEIPLGAKQPGQLFLDPGQTADQPGILTVFVQVPFDRV